MPLNLFYTMMQKSQKWPKTQIKGGGGGSCLNNVSSTVINKIKITPSSVSTANSINYEGEINKVIRLTRYRLRRRHAPSLLLQMW